MSDLRQRDDDEVEPVPGISQIVEVAEYETSRQNFHKAFERVDRREYLSASNSNNNSLTTLSLPW